MNLEKTIRLPTVSWIDGMRFAGCSASGHSIVMDISEAKGGSNTGPSPMEMILLGIGGCASVDVVSILKKAKQAVVHCEAKIASKKSEGTPSVFTKIHLHFMVSGQNLSEEQVERAVALSAEKYCSAAIMIGRSGTEVTFSSEIKDIDSIENC